MKESLFLNRNRIPLDRVWFLVPLPNHLDLASVTVVRQDTVSVDEKPPCRCTRR